MGYPLHTTQIANNLWGSQPVTVNVVLIGDRYRLVHVITCHIGATVGNNGEVHRGPPVLRLRIEGAEIDSHS
jgi:hypothetical protein